MKNFFSLMFLVVLFLCSSFPYGVSIDNNCTINILNRTVQVGSDGSWAMPNVPSFMGRVRARATCVKDGMSISGQSDFFTVQNNETVTVGEIVFENLDPVPVALKFVHAGMVYLNPDVNSIQLNSYATYADDSISLDTLTAADGINFISSNPNIVSVDANGVLTAVNSGSAVITARLEGVIALKQVQVSFSGDIDRDGLPDDYVSASKSTHWPSQKSRVMTCSTAASALPLLPSSCRQCCL